MDGQNLFHAARAAFGYTTPNYDVMALARAIGRQAGWSVTDVRFYTGMPSAHENPFWHSFWVRKLSAMGRSGVRVVTRPLRYRQRQVVLAGGRVGTARIGVEKGIDVRIALDATRVGLSGICQVVVIVSLDQDLAEAVREIHDLAPLPQPKVCCAYLAGAVSVHPLAGAVPVPISREMYDRCLDQRNYGREAMS